MNCVSTDTVISDTVSILKNAAAQLYRTVKGGLFVRICVACVAVATLRYRGFPAKRRSVARIGCCGSTPGAIPSQHNGELSAVSNLTDCVSTCNSTDYTFCQRRLPANGNTINSVGTGNNPRYRSFTRRSSKRRR